MTLVNLPLDEDVDGRRKMELSVNGGNGDGDGEGRDLKLNNLSRAATKYLEFISAALITTTCR